MQKYVVFMYSYIHGNGDEARIKSLKSQFHLFASFATATVSVTVLNKANTATYLSTYIQSLAKITWVKGAHGRLIRLSRLKRQLLRMDSNMGSLSIISVLLHFCTSFVCHCPASFGQTLYLRKLRGKKNPIQLTLSKIEVNVPNTLICLYCSLLSSLRCGASDILDLIIIEAIVDVNLRRSVSISCERLKRRTEDMTILKGQILGLQSSSSIKIYTPVVSTLH